MDQFVPRKKVLEVLNIHYNTLQNIVHRKEIEYVVVGSNRLYNLNKYLRLNKITVGEKKNIIYCRVSSKKQEKDLVRQKEALKKKYSTYEVIKDIGSGLNFNRKGLNEIIKLSIEGKIDNLVISYKDRLARFGYELIENLIINYSNGKIIIDNKKEEETPEEEMTKDLVSIMNVYVAKVNGLRKYKKKMSDEIKVCRINKKDEM